MADTRPARRSLPASPTTTTRRATSPRRWRQRCAPRTPPSACTPRRGGCARSSGRWRCGTACPTRRRVAGIDHVELYWRTASTPARDGDLARTEQLLLERALRLIDDEAEPRARGRPARAARRALWQLGRGGADDREHERGARRCSPDDGPTAERGAAARRQAKALMLAGRATREVARGRRASARGGDAVGADERAEPRAATRSASRCARSGDVEAGIAQLREALDSRERDELRRRCAARYLNLADALLRRRPQREALDGRRRRASREQRAATGAGAAGCGMHVAEIAVDARRLGRRRGGAADQRPPPEGHHGAHTRSCAAQLALGRAATRRSARGRSTRRRARWRESPEPQWLGALRPRCAASSTGARATSTPRARAVDEALDRLEFCTRGRARIARRRRRRLAVEADAAERARDLGDDAGAEARSRARETMLRCVRARAEASRPGGARVWIADGRGRAARARRGHRRSRAVGGAAEAWDGAGASLRARDALWRQAEAHARAPAIARPPPPRRRRGAADRARGSARAGWRRGRGPGARVRGCALDAAARAGRRGAGAEAPRTTRSA